MFLSKRVYDEPEKSDGTRVLVDRLWPRGLSREAAKIEVWMKDIAPGDELRKWFAHRDDRWEEFRVRYRAELDTKPELVKQLLDLGRHHRVTLLYSAHDTERNNSRVLLEYLREQEREESRREAVGTAG
jgi:uncharacterized protein YeaO (DUF488 family)